MGPTTSSRSRQRRTANWWSRERQCARARPSAESLLARYTEDGQLDPGFGGGDGVVLTQLGPSAADVTVQADGRIIVVGESNGMVGAARYLDNGSLDTSFSGDGLVTTEVLDASTAHAVTLQDDGSIVVGGSAEHFDSESTRFALVRYTPTGALDSSFDGDGIVDDHDRRGRGDNQPRRRC